MCTQCNNVRERQPTQPLGLLNNLYNNYARGLKLTAKLVKAEENENLMHVLSVSDTMSFKNLTLFHVYYLEIFAF